MQAPSGEWVTQASILTFGGASFGVWAVTLAFQKLTKRNWFAFPFILAGVIAFGLAADAASLYNWKEWLVALINTCVLAFAATGINEAAAGRPDGGLRPHGRSGALLQSWFR